MKKTLSILSLTFLIFLAGCGKNEDKSRHCLDKGIDYLYCSQYEEAIEYFDKAIKYNSDNFEAYFYRGCAKYNILKKEEALEDYNKAIEINPNYIKAYFNIGLYYRGINDYDMACYYFKIAEKLGRPNMEDYTKHCH